ncbi:MAG: response regulator transcription factor [Gammaproteobacteria bacterium]|nr:response regulator transcription factor [Gammaproteobacteria bacterium]
MSHSAIIVDDEATLIDYLLAKLTRLWPELEIVGTAKNGREALALAREHQPDIAFLDIHMPGLSGLDVAQALPSSMKIVFITAFDQYAIEAFEQAAVDYILKPINENRLQQTIQRLKENHKNNHSELLSLIKEINPTTSEFLHWIRAGFEDTTELVAVDDVIFFQADQKYTSVVTKTQEHFVRMSVKDLEGKLDPEKFWRIHRSTIVRIDQIVSAKRDLRGRYALTLRERPETLRSSQPYGHLFKHM